ncbi:hypothetical protein C8F01DRAFT_468807 [Mycena amicta]|nr:hypothetical protein C8F01DRAFT_468807 [Mycena amicta]
MQYRPFTTKEDFYPGLIIWCDIRGKDHAARSLLAMGEKEERRQKSRRSQRPYLLVALDEQREEIHVTRIVDKQPHDSSEWVRMDTAAPRFICTVHNNPRWIWVGKPVTLRMVFDKSHIMHAQHDPKHNCGRYRCAEEHVQIYQVHRNRHLDWCPRCAESRETVANTAATPIPSDSAPVPPVRGLGPTHTPASFRDSSSSPDSVMAGPQTTMTRFFARGRGQRGFTDFEECIR